MDKQLLQEHLNQLLIITDDIEQESSKFAEDYVRINNLPPTSILPLKCGYLLGSIETITRNVNKLIDLNK